MGAQFWWGSVVGALGMGYLLGKTLQEAWAEADQWRDRFLHVAEELHQLKHPEEPARGGLRLVKGGREEDA